MSLITLQIENVHIHAKDQKLDEIVALLIKQMEDPDGKLKEKIKEEITAAVTEIKGIV